MIQAGLPRPAKPNEMVAIDLEIFGMQEGRLHLPEGRFACMTMAYGPKEVYQIYDEHDVREALLRLDKGLWVFHNAVFDLRQLMRWATIKRRLIHDTLLFDKNLFGGYYDTFGLDDLSRRWLHDYMDKSVREQFEEATTMTSAMNKYAAKDAVNTWKIAQAQLKFSKDSGESLSSYYDVDAPMIWVVLNMKPFKVDVPAWLKLNKLHEELAKELEESLGFNVKSVPQTKKAVFEVTRRSIKSTGADILEDLALELTNQKQQDFVLRILQARRYRDMVSKYGDAWLNQNVGEGQLVYPSWNITGAETGRMSCSNPNMQQIPRQDFPVYRSFFISNEGNLIVADVSQQEPSILAYLSRDPRLSEIIKSGKSSHVEVGKEIIDPKMSKEHRQYHWAKTVNLGLSYGLSKHGLAKQLHISEDEAEGLIRAYFSRFSGVQSYMERSRAMGVRTGLVRTLMDRKIHLNPYNRQSGNNAINGPIQGSAAEETKMASINLLDWCTLERVEFPLCGIIHDEVVLDCPTGMVPKYKEGLKASWDATADRLTPGYPVRIEVFSGKNWGVKK
jgi:DNA polymerase-1